MFFSNDCGPDRVVFDNIRYPEGRWYAENDLIVCL
jgi:hypothetical protein